MITENEPILLRLLPDPLSLIVETRHEIMTIPLSEQSAVELCCALLAIPAVAGNFNEIAERIVAGRMMRRQSARN